MVHALQVVCDDFKVASCMPALSDLPLLALTSPLLGPVLHPPHQYSMVVLDGRNKVECTDSDGDKMHKSSSEHTTPIDGITSPMTGAPMSGIISPNHLARRYLQYQAQLTVQGPCSFHISRDLALQTLRY